MAITHDPIEVYPTDGTCAASPCVWERREPTGPDTYKVVGYELRWQNRRGAWCRRSFRTEGSARAIAERVAQTGADK